MFKTGHALPLASARLLRPRSNRGEHAEYPHELSGSWPLARQIRDHDSAEDMTRAQTVRVREQSVSAFSPRKQAQTQTVRVPGKAAASIVRAPAAVTDLNCPQTVRSRELSTSANLQRPRAVHEMRLAKNYPRYCIAVAILPQISFPVRIQINPAYVLV